jgi:diguanylate cyclase (GGDEF)-like protein
MRRNSAGSSRRALAVLDRQENTEAAVIFSLSILGCAATLYFEGFQQLHSLAQAHRGWQLEKLSTVLLFFGVALAVFGTRRVVQQRQERKRRLAAERRARSLAYRDTLTKLPNRRQFEQELFAALKSGENSELTVVLADVNGFQAVNDMYGHAGGDAALAQIAARLKARVPGDVTLARFGDDEFAFCLRDGSDTATHMADLIADVLSEPVQVGNEKRTLGVTMGLARSGSQSNTVGEILRRAHVALYRAKSTHASRCFFDPDMDVHIQERSILEKDLRAALGTSAIHPYYQPIIDLETGQIVSFEALARWTHPERGPISPALFIPVADDLGLIDELTGQLFGQACRDATTWPPEVSLSFNFSPSQLRDISFSESVLAILRDTGLAAHRLEAEVTEGALVADLEAAREVLGALRQVGVRIVMDDFGTGYSSLYHLRQLRFDKLKIDRSFVQEINRDGESKVIVRAIAGMGKGLDLLLTAEGIETNEQALGVMAHGIHQAQGFLYGRAMPAGEARRLLSASEQLAAA